MSDQEQDEIILRVIKDARAAHQEAALLREKAQAICEDLGAVLSFLRKIVGYSAVGSGHPREDLATSFDRLPNGLEIRDLSQKLKAAIDRDAELSRRKQELGI